MAASNTNVPTTADVIAPETPWHAAFPPVKGLPGHVTKEEVLSWFLRGEKSGMGFVLVDVRRMDHKGGTIRGSLNLPAQSLYPSIPALYAVLKSAGVEAVVWYCGLCFHYKPLEPRFEGEPTLGLGSSSGRGPRAAGWFQDYIDGKGDKQMKSCVLRGGIKEWAKAGGKFVEWMDGFEEEVWR
ncbi:hypothetical protein MMC30_005446 [Trapelia coarctata]|nr:hypothetical protein [Trapelia coarctata]